MMNASEIKFCAKAFAGWEDYNCVSFQTGNLALPRILAERFERDLAGWRSGDYKFKADTENAVNALVHLLTIQGNEFSERNKSGSFACSFFVTEHLDAALKKAWEADNNLPRHLDTRTIPQAA